MACLGCNYCKKYQKYHLLYVCTKAWRIAQVKAEIEALHGRKAEAMRAMTQAQRRELEDICAASHMAVPPMPPAPSAEAGLSGAALCDQVGSLPLSALLQPSAST